MHSLHPSYGKLISSGSSLQSPIEEAAVWPRRHLNGPNHFTRRRAQSRCTETIRVIRGESLYETKVYKISRPEAEVTVRHSFFTPKNSCFIRVILACL